VKFLAAVIAHSRRPAKRLDGAPAATHVERAAHAPPVGGESPASRPRPSDPGRPVPAASNRKLSAAEHSVPEATPQARIRELDTTSVSAGSNGEHPVPAPESPAVSTRPAQRPLERAVVEQQAHAPRADGTDDRAAAMEPPLEPRSAGSAVTPDGPAVADLSPPSVEQKPGRGQPTILSAGEVRHPVSGTAPVAPETRAPGPPAPSRAGQAEAALDAEKPAGTVIQAAAAPVPDADSIPTPTPPEQPAVEPAVHLQPPTAPGTAALPGSTQRPESRRPEPEVPQVRIGQINLLVEEQTPASPRRPQAASRPAAANPFGLRGL